MLAVVGFIALSGLVEAATFSNSSVPAIPSASQSAAASSKIESSTVRVASSSVSQQQSSVSFASSAAGSVSAKSSASLSGSTSSRASGSSSGSASATSCATVNTDCTYWIDTSTVTFPTTTEPDSILKVTATEVPITYKYSDGRIASIVTSTFTNFQSNISFTENAAFTTPSVKLKTWEFGAYTLTHPTTYFAIWRGTVTGYPAPTAGSPLVNTCKKSEIEAEIALPPVPVSDLVAIASEKSAAFAQLTSSVDPSLCRQFPLSIPAHAPATSRTIAFETTSAPPVQYTSVQVLVQQGQGATVTVPDGFGVAPTATGPAGNGDARPPGNGDTNPPGNGGTNPTGGSGSVQQITPPGQGGNGPEAGQQQQQQQQQQTGPVGPAGPVVVGGEVVTPAPGGGVIIGGSTVAPGSGGTINNIPFSVAPGGGAVVVGGQTANIPGGAAPTPINVGGQQVTPVAGGGIIVGGSSLAAGGAITVGGTVISAGQGGEVVVGGQTATVGGFFPGAGSPITVNGATLTPIPGGAAIINGQTIQPGVVTNLPNGQQVSIGPNGGVVVVNGQTATVPGPRGAGSPVTVAGSGVTPLPGGGFVVGGTTILPGNSVTLPNGQVVSIGNGGQVVVNGQTTNVQLPHGGPEPVNVNGALVTPLPGGAIIVNGQRILPGQKTTLANGQVISLAPGGSAIVVNGQTATLSPLVAVAPVVINGATITPGPNGAVVVGGKTLSAGQIVTLSDGHVVSIGTSGTVVVDGSTTKIPVVSSGQTSTSSNSSTSITSSTSSSTRSVGDAIASGIGVTKKADANAVFVANLDTQIGVGLLLGLLGFIGVL